LQDFSKYLIEPKLERGKYNRKRRIFRHSTSSLIPLQLGKDQVTDHFYSEQDLFDNQSEMAVPSTSGAGLAAPPATNEQLFHSPLVITNTKQLYDMIAVNQAAFQASEFVDSIRYQGFERSSFIIAAALQISSSQFIRLALIGAIRGANFEKIQKSSAKLDDDIVSLFTRSIVKRKANGPKEITILRCTAAIPQWCAYFLGQSSVVKKLPNMECPASLQFPAAGSLPMSKELRLQHIRFCMYFSKVIKGTFNENIYMTMMNNPIPTEEIPDMLRLVLGSPDTTVDVMGYIEEVKKEIGSSVVKA
jgi:hypothetical protein